MARVVYSAKRLLAALGCKITLLGQEPDGLFEHGAEPLAANLQGVCEIAPERLKPTSPFAKIPMRIDWPLSMNEAIT